MAGYGGIWRGVAGCYGGEYRHVRIRFTFMSSVRKRKLIEVALPLDAINAASKKEKSIFFGHPSSLHIWWSRKPLAACRAVLFASLLDDPSCDGSLTEAE